MKRIIYTNRFGQLCVVCNYPKVNIEEMIGSLTQKDYESHCWERGVPSDAVNPRWADLSDFPLDDFHEEFFEAWEDNGKKIIINLSKAKIIQIDKLRKKRNFLLKEKYDGLLNRAIEIGTPEEVAEIKRKKQELRDITNSLKNLEPKCLQDIKDCTPHLEDL